MSDSVRLHDSTYCNTPGLPVPHCLPEFTQKSIRIVNSTELFDLKFLVSELVLPLLGLFRDLPGGPVAKTPHSRCRGPGFDPWSGN